MSQRKNKFRALAGINLLIFRNCYTTQNTLIDNYNYYITFLWWPRSAKEIYFDKKGFYIKNPVFNLKISFLI